jgi:hypothetical protein
LPFKGGYNRKMPRELELTPFAPLAGTAATLAVISNFNLNGIPIQTIALPALAVGIIVGLWLCCRCGWREITAIFIVFALPAIHFLAPVVYSNATLALVDAGDFGQYMAVSNWLLMHPITQPAGIGDDFTLLNPFVRNHQLEHLRMGSLFLLTLLAVVTGREIIEVYTPFCAALVGLQAVSAYALTRAAFPALSRRGHMIVGVLYGVSPIVVWAAVAAFIAQALGLAFLTAWIALFVGILRNDKADAPSVIVIALLIFGTWSVYPEAAPLGVMICGLYFLLSRQSIPLWWPPAVTIVALAFLISPQTAIWGMKGLLAQLSGLPHGGEMVVSPLHLFGTIVGATQAPLVPPIILNLPPYAVAVCVAMCAVAVGGLAVSLWRGDRALSITFVAIAAFLFAFVAFKYRHSAYGHLATWSALFSWNLFKAAQYAATIIYPLAIGGALLAASMLPASLARRAAAVLVIAILLGVVAGQDRQVWSRIYTTSLDPMLKPAIERIPPGGRVHVDAPQTNPYERFILYGLLRGRQFTSEQDASYTPREFSVPIAHIFKDPRPPTP